MVLTNHTLANLPRLKRIIQTQTADVRVGANALDAGEILDLGVDFHVTSCHRYVLNP